MFFRVLFFAIALLNVAWWIWADRRLRALRSPTFWRIMLGLFCATQLLWLFCWNAGPRFVRDSHSWGPRVIVAGLFLWHLFILPMALLLGAAADLCHRFFLLVYGLFKPDSARQDREQENPGHHLTRRQILAAVTVAVPPMLLGAGVWGGMEQIGKFRIRRLNFLLNTLPRELDGMTICQISDTHIGRFTTDKMMNQVADTANSLKSDLVLLTGDLIDFNIEDLPSALNFVRRLDPRSGLAMCMGNHDEVDNERRFITDVRAAGIPLLIGQRLQVAVRNHPVNIFGIDWEHDQNKLRTLVQQLGNPFVAGGYPILMAHHPHAFDPAAAAGFPVTLSGHTHGGQLMLSETLGAGPAMFRYWSGPYSKGESKLMVSNGVGNWFPLRINAPAEIVHITLRRQEA